MTFEEEIVRRARDLQHWSFEELFNTLLECLETLRVLHAHGYVHGNLTPRHIVCDELGSLKIAD
jgi:tRNA A-37 threonylcarbamoyl transferase component Bud32